MCIRDRGTTGLKIFDRLKKREDIELLTLPDELRKDIKSRKEALNSADTVSYTHLLRR